MTTSKKQIKVSSEVVSRREYTEMKKQRDMWREDFNSLFDIVVNMSLWQRIKYVFTKGVK
jgi:cytidylate kinase